LTSVVVVGGGAVGLCVAESLATRGAEVTVIERDLCGRGASAGNAGWITPSLATPVPAPGVMGQSLRWLLRSDGPLWIRPTLSPAMLAWISQFLVSCSGRAYRHGLEVLQAIAERSPASFDALAERGAKFELHPQELLYPAFSEPELNDLLRFAAELDEVGIGPRIQRVSGTEMVALEPALSGRCIGGLVGSGERRVRPETVTAGVKARLLELGGSLHEYTPADSIAHDGGGWIVTGARREWRAAAVVVATGFVSGDLLRGLGVRLRVAAAKGYSRTFASTDSGPGRPLYLEEPKVAVSVFDGGVRVSGTLELGARGLALSQRRLQAITAAAQKAMPGWKLPLDPVDWAGMRPLSPDGLPYIGAVPKRPGLYVATGHGTLGITLAPLTGELLADLILDGRTDPLISEFGVGRGI
jgi:D-amino-acid dehydrogenase